ncbi:NAD(P)H-dependent oxidoreductase [Paenibacillus sp. SYP-B3998]|uniref:NAD(P)H-dependent oxidoreductase n=1 Tax=Paenibacillus sp. SYP-B3998 TaxID=2678564 RepID=A0A6G3ZZ26_9BACL|nr:NAD(P)H-dependent oxidoreductase [Paenibacillus sp. SYP-B3998]NEW07350.1 NAD(P)H-dependent oxidoreductase [Paenibacillus sp. SYP-B3998]
MHPNIAIINGHPYAESYCTALSEAYKKGAIASGSAVRSIHIGSLDFEPNLKFGYSKRMDLEADLLAAQETIRWADHLVFVYPIWWGTVPAVMKGFIDRVFLPGFAYKTRPNSAMWDKLLKGKSARLIVTMDSPSWYYRLVYKQAGHLIMKRGTLQYSGINPVKITELGPIKSSTDKQREKWLAKVEALGVKRS